MRTLAAEAEVEREAETAKLLADLGREPSYSDRILVGEIAALRVRARRLRQRGRDDAAEMCSRLILRAMTKLGVKPGQAKPESLEDYLARTAAQDASAGQARDESGAVESDCRDDDKHTGEASKGSSEAAA